MPMCDKIRHWWITSNDYFFKQNSFVYKPKLVRCYTSNDHFIFKPYVFCRQRILESHYRLRTPFTLFGLSLLECNEPVTGSFTRGGVSSPSCYYPTQVSISCNRATLLDFVQWYRAYPSITKCVVDSNHALTPMKCDVPEHMQCDVPLHVNSMSQM